MEIRKLIALVLIIAFTSLFPAQISSADEKEQTLYQFIKENKEFSANFEYPSYIASSNALGKKLLPAHSPIMIKNISEINTKNIKSGDTVTFIVAQDVKDENGNILVKSGTSVNANVNFESKTYIGRSAKITVTDFHTKAVDNTYIPLSTVITEAPDDKMVLSIMLSVFLCPLFLLMKGKDANIPAGTLKTIYTITDTYIKPDIM